MARASYQYRNWPPAKILGVVFVVDATVTFGRWRAMLEWMPEPQWSFSNRWLSVATFARGCGMEVKTLIRRLAAEGIEARPVWKPMHLQPVFAGAVYFAHDESVSQDLFDRGICLPSETNMTESQPT